MKIALCIKQVPDTADIKWTENNTIQREGLESVINPFDMYAIETALRIKDNISNAQTTVLTMGPPQAEDIIKKAIAMGVDNGFLVSDRKFAGADTIATGRTLAAAIETKINDFDLIICGQFATDGDTAQTGPTIANFLNIPQITYVKEIINVNKDFVTVKKEVEDGTEILKVKLPALLCMLKCEYEPRRPLINGFINAQNAVVPTYSAEDINLMSENVGMKGSPTMVSRAFRPEPKQGGEIHKNLTANDAANLILENIQSESTND